MSLHEQMETIGRQARDAANSLRSVTRAKKDAALLQIARGIRQSHEPLMRVNERDLRTGRENGLSGALLDRLAINPARIDAMAEGLEVVAALADPVGEIVSQTIRPNGLRVAQVRQPLGVVGIIYESRPNVTADAAGLCLKSGNACILRGGSEAVNTNAAIADLFTQGLASVGLPEHAVQFIPTTDRAAVGEMLKMDRYIDLIVPRGGKGLIARILDESRIPVVAHLDGVCHTYVHADADLQMAQSLCLNAKLQRPGTCNAMETLLVHSSVAQAFLPPFADALRKANCEIRGCSRTRAVIECKEATEEDWTAEYLDKILAIKVVDSLEEAIDHINTYGSHHSDAIVTEGYAPAEKFLDDVDSAAVYVNASTRFTDGFEFGLGAEIGISTSKLHCRGPMALKELTTLKYVVRGSGQVRG